jgi:hypothetical protein
LLEFNSALREKAGFLLAGAAESPFGGYQIFQERFFGGPEGLVLGYEGFAEAFEIVCLFGSRQQDVGSKSMRQGIQADGSASFGCLGAGALLSVAAICVNLGLSCHSVPFCSKGTGRFGDCKRRVS